MSTITLYYNLCDNPNIQAITFPVQGNLFNWHNGEICYRAEVVNGKELSVQFIPLREVHRWQLAILT